MNTAAGNHKISIPGMIYISHAGSIPYKLRRIMNEESGLNKKKQAAIEVVQECFWGDYLVTPQDILERLEKKDAAFGRFLFSKIIENSRHPSKHLKALFPMEDLLPMLDRYLSMSGGKKRVRLVAANITGDHSLVPELQWKR